MTIHYTTKLFHLGQGVVHVSVINSTRNFFVYFSSDSLLNAPLEQIFQ